MTWTDVGWVVPTVFLSASLLTPGCGGPPPVPGPAPAPTPAPVTVPAPAVDRAAELLEAHNAERRKQGEPPLTLNADLQRMAQGWAADMARSGTMSHARFQARLDASGYPAGYAGENVAEGDRTVEGVVAGWMHSPGHRRNILSGDYAEAGFGVAAGPGLNGAGTLYWCADFGRSRTSGAKGSVVIHLGTDPKP